MQRRSGQLETGSAGVQVAATLDLQSLRSRCEAGEEFKFLLFWGHTVPTGGQVGKTCLSQWYPSPFTVDGVLYRTAEHFMMAEKARIFGDDEKLAEILAAAKAPQVSTPWRHENAAANAPCLQAPVNALFVILTVHCLRLDQMNVCVEPELLVQAKKLGRLVEGFDAAVWAEHCRRIVTEASEHKFAQNPHLKEFLLSTGETVLVEASPYDNVWGIGLAANDPLALDPRTWKGENLLGFSLMDARSALQEL